MQYVLVFDIGKTNVKVMVLDECLNTIFERCRPNRVLNVNPYPHYDVEGIWGWFLSVTAEACRQFDISAISVTTHGATAALIDRSRNDDGLVLPIMDYESSLPESRSPEYSQVRPGFTETCSPNLPGGLNLGRQLFWQQHAYPDEFSGATDILMYPQYWVWRLTGERCTEVTSLGCHTDLWAPKRGEFSTLVGALGWRDHFPTIRAADSIAGTIKSSVRDLTGLPKTCQVSVGIHDSNASYLRYVRNNKGKAFSVISTGTWAITMAAGGLCDDLQEARDMLANVDYRGRPVACARFMAGREYETLCYRMGACVDEHFDVLDLSAIVDDNVMAFPQFIDQSGPFSECKGWVNADVNRINGPALASVYCALMLDLELDLLRVKGDIFIEGAFLKNRLLCGFLAALRPGQTIFLSQDTTGTAKGAACLLGFQDQVDLAVERCSAIKLHGVEEYQQSWRHMVYKCVTVD